MVPLGLYKAKPVLILLSYLTMGKEQVILGANSFGDRRNATAEVKHLSPAEGANISDCISLFHSKLSWRPKDTSGSPRWLEKVLPWAGPLLLSWAGLLGWRELMAIRQCCRETALPRSISSAKHSGAEGTVCRQRGERSEAKRG